MFGWKNENPDHFVKTSLTDKEFYDLINKYLNKGLILKEIAPKINWNYDTMKKKYKYICDKHKWENFSFHYSKNNIELTKDWFEKNFIPCLNEHVGLRTLARKYKISASRLRKFYHKYYGYTLKTKRGVESCLGKNDQEKYNLIKPFKDMKLTWAEIEKKVFEIHKIKISASQIQKTFNTIIRKHKNDSLFIWKY